jgi:hypothetical protein
VRVAAVIPWRGGQPDRERHHQTVRAHLRDLLPDAWHIDADSGHTPFSRAGSRNHGVRLAQDAGCDVVVICDADTLPEREPLLAAVDGAHDGRLHLPYVHFKGLSRKGTNRYLRGVPPEQCETELAHDHATGGCLVITPNAWWRAGGMDERFIAYGFEDVAFRIAADALLGPTVKHEGTIWHLWHVKTMGLGSPQHIANGALASRYVAAEGRPDVVRSLVREFTEALRTENRT